MSCMADTAETNTVALVEELRLASDGGTQERIDRLDQALASLKQDSDLYGRAIARLRVLCRRTGHLPSSCFLEGDIELESNQPLHRTALSDVYQGRRGTVLVALKSLRLHGDDKGKVEKSFRDEVVAWRCLRHPNIVPFLGISDILPVCLVSEWMAHGGIVSFLRQNPSEDRLKYARDVVNGLCYMHSNGIVHGDLKGANILVDASRRARVADFGLTALLQSTCTVTATASARGTLRWMSPELLDDRLAPSSGRPTMASDMFAIAMVFWEIFTGRIPFDDIPADFRVLLDVLSGKRPMRPTGGANGLTDEVWSVMENCWEASPDARPSCAEVVHRLGGTLMQAPGFALDAREMTLDSDDSELSGIYEILNVKNAAALDLDKGNDHAVIWWEPHAGDNQRWEVKKEGGGYTLRNLVNREYIQGRSLDSEVTDLSTKKSPFVWDISASSGAYAILLIKERYAITVAQHSLNILRPYNASFPTQQWRFIREPEEKGGLEGVYEIVNLGSGNKLELPDTGSSRRSRSSGSAVTKRLWELCTTRRGYAIRSIANAHFITVAGHKPVYEGMSLATISQPRSWKFEPVVGQGMADVYRIYWPDKAHAIGVSSAIAFQDFAEYKTRIFSAALGGAHLHWRLVRELPEVGRVEEEVQARDEVDLGEAFQI